MNAYGFEPDFENLKITLTGGKGYRVPNIEFLICQKNMSGFLGRPVLTAEDEVEFYYLAGYDFARTSCGLIDLSGVHNKNSVSDDDDKNVSEDGRRWADEHNGLLKTLDDVYFYPWPDPDTMDYSDYDEKAKSLKPGMKMISVLGKIFTTTWQLLGFERFVEVLYDNPEMIDELFNRIADIQIRVLKRYLETDSLGAVCISEDIAYKTGPMLSPNWFKEKLFPFYRTMTTLCHDAGAPIIYHSDGDMTSLLDNVIETGFDAIHPIEPECMDIYEVRKKIKAHICLVGNICVDTLARGTTTEIFELAKDRILHLGHSGAYCLGSSNSIPDYVPLENYKTMLKAYAEYGKIS